MTPLSLDILKLVSTLKDAEMLPNIPFPTMGGKVFWNDIAEKDGWRVQKNMFTSHCRVLNPNNVRVAWGFSEEALLAELQKVARGAGASARAEGSPSPATATTATHGAASDVKSRLDTLKGLLADGVITQAEHDAKRAEILKDL